MGGEKLKLDLISLFAQKTQEQDGNMLTVYDYSLVKAISVPLLQASYIFKQVTFTHLRNSQQQKKWDKTKINIWIFQ